MLWKAPEILRDPYAPVGGTFKGDVYAFAIIMQEIIGRRGPYGGCGIDEPSGIFITLVNKTMFLFKCSLIYTIAGMMGQWLRLCTTEYKV